MHIAANRKRRLTVQAIEGPLRFADDNRPDPKKTTTSMQMILVEPSNALISRSSQSNDVTKIYGEISNVIDDHLVKKKRLDQFESSIVDKPSQAPYFYVKMVTVADNIYEHQAWTVFKYNSGLYHVRVVTERLFKLMESIEDRLILETLSQCLDGSKMENALKIRFLNVLLSKSSLIKTVPKIQLDECVFEMIYNQISQKIGRINFEQFRQLMQSMDGMLLGIYKNSYGNATSRIFLDILDKTGAAKPVFKSNKSKTVTYLSQSEVDLKHYGDYLVVVMACLILFDCGDFIGMYLAMERDASFLIKMMSRINESSCDIVLRRVTADYREQLIEKVSSLLFLKSWSQFKEIDEILREILNSKDLETKYKADFYSYCLEKVLTSHKYANNFDKCLALLIESATPDIISEVKIKLLDRSQTDETYTAIDDYIIKTLTSEELPHKQRVLLSLLIRQQTLQRLKRCPNINLDLDDITSLPNLLITGESMIMEPRLLITDGSSGEMISYLLKDGDENVDKLQYENQDNSHEEIVQVTDSDDGTDREVDNNEMDNKLILDSDNDVDNSVDNDSSYGLESGIFSDDEIKAEEVKDDSIGDEIEENGSNEDNNDIKGVDNDDNIAENDNENVHLLDKSKNVIVYKLCVLEDD